MRDKTPIMPGSWKPIRVGSWILECAWAMTCLSSVFAYRRTYEQLSVRLGSEAVADFGDTGSMERRTTMPIRRASISNNFPALDIDAS